MNVICSPLPVYNNLKLMAEDIDYKALIKYLDLEDGRYIENDKIKYNVSKDNDKEYISWDELWTGIKNDIEKIQNFFKNKTIK